MATPAEGMLSDICGSDLFNSISKTLQYDVFTESRFEDAVKIVKTLSEDVIVPIATMMICIYFLLNIIDKMTSENFTWEQLARVLVMLVVGKFLIENSFEILTKLYAIGIELVEMVVSALGTGSEKNADVNVALEAYKNMKEGKSGIMKVLWDLLMMFVLLFPWLISWIMRLVVKIICYTRMIEILVRAAFSPLALSDFFQNGLSGSGWRWLKNFLAVCLQGVVIMAISLLYSAILGGIIDSELLAAGKPDGTLWDFGLFQFCGIYLALMASAVMLMFKSLSLSKEILGTGG